MRWSRSCPIASRARSADEIPAEAASSSSCRRQSGCSLTSNRIVRSFGMRQLYGLPPYLQRTGPSPQP